MMAMEDQDVIQDFWFGKGGSLVKMLYLELNGKGEDFGVEVGEASSPM